MSQIYFLQIAFRKWTSTDRSQLEDLRKSPDDFAELLFDYLHKLKTHSFVNQEQQAELRKRKEQLQPGEVFVQTYLRNIQQTNI